MCTIIPPKGVKWQSPSNVHLNWVRFDYVYCFKCPGHIIKNELTDDDILREVSSVSVRGHFLFRKFSFCKLDVCDASPKLFLFFVFLFFLWMNSQRSTLDRLKVCFIIIMRLGIRKFDELLRYSYFSCCQKLLCESVNTLLCELVNTETTYWFRIRNNWFSTMYF